MALVMKLTRVKLDVKGSDVQGSLQEMGVVGWVMNNWGPWTLYTLFRREWKLDLGNDKVRAVAVGFDGAQ